MRGKKSKQPAPPPVPSFRPSDFKEADPAAFYLLGPGRVDMEALADATLVVGGTRLPAHSQVRGMERQGMPTCRSNAPLQRVQPTHLRPPTHAAGRC